ncbi:hypothetical protein Ddye_016356 [Dipteronia dyeriana]|uniref:Uncharacterized protein n=1 Tax=Dipteronia dyeriana TaxID=168575 RepID=A0AAD9U7H3_9ROSI|nr:hypothetical protein Ddye_016356 [Dipteronia dyeriana]
MQEERPEVMVIMETKSREGNMENLRVKLGYEGNLVVDCVGKSGGLVMFWDKIIDVSLLSFNIGHIDVSIQVAKNHAFESMLEKINSSTNRLGDWNIRKRVDHKKKINKWGKELKMAINRDNPASWKNIAYCEEKLDVALETEEIYWRQRAKVDWLNNRDKNLRFFQAKASVRKARNRIKGLKDELSVWKGDDDEMEGIISSYFSKLFTSSNPPLVAIKLILDNVEKTIPSYMITVLDAKYNEKDVKGRADEKNCRPARKVLEDYAIATGQLVNFSKSAVCMSLSMCTQDMENLADLVGMKLMDCHERLPKTLIEEIYRLSARFWLDGGNENKRKMHWCSWDRLCKPKRDGGLRFRDLETFNRALLANQ